MRAQWIALLLVFVQPIFAAQPQLKCEKKFGKLDWQGMVFHRYCLRAENFPPRQTFRLIVKSFDGTETETFRYFANHRGHLIFQPTEEYEGDIVAICPAKRGERLTFIMQSEVGKEAYATEIIPFPLEMRSTKGVKLSLELQSEQGESFDLLATGLQAGEEVTLTLQVGKEEIPLEATVTALGELYSRVEIPLHAEEGEVKLILSRKNEEVVFPFEWGTPALKLVGACCFEIK